MNKIKRIYFIYFFISIAVGIVGLFVYLDYSRKKKSVSKVVVDKTSLKMHVLNLFADTIYNFPIAVGTNYGQKEKVGDLKTPEGVFPVESIEDAKDWKYDFEDDDQGPVDGAYGPWFIRLTVKNAKGIGIHGTHDNGTIGKRVSHGCVRMKNEDLKVLVDLMIPGIEVVITPDTTTVK